MGNAKGKMDAIFPKNPFWCSTLVTIFRRFVQMIRIIRMYLSSIAPQTKSSGHFAVSYIFLPVFSSFFSRRTFMDLPAALQVQ